MTPFGSDTSTRADTDLYLRARMVDVSCASCSAVVAVKKNSEQHTSIQWNRSAVSACREFAELASQPGGRAAYATCPSLVASIEAAVAAGALDIGATDGY